MNTWQEKFGLTPSEVEIASAVVKGYSNRKIAESFKISLHVVMYRLWKIADKLGVSTRSALLATLGNGPEEADEAGIAVKKPKSPNLDNGSAAASLDE